MAAAEKDNKDDKDETEGEDQAPKKKNNFPVIGIIIGIVISIVIGGAGYAAYFFLIKSAATDDTKKAAAQIKPQIMSYYPMDPYIVNLIDNEGERYLKVVMQLELTDLQVVEELNLVKPKLRDGILDLLSAKTYKELTDPLGKQRLRDEIAMRANVYATKGKVTKVYFTEFVIQ